MRLICGLWHLDGRPAAARMLASMTRSMIAPGLKAQIRTWNDGPLGLAVLQTSSRETSTAPLPQAVDGCVLAADVRLDDRQALARALALVESDDDALLLAAVGRWGAQAAYYVLGDFAFAAWNPRTMTLLCARDPMGIRPLVYLYQPEKLFAFASLPLGLHRAGLIKRRLDEEAFARRIAHAWRANDTLMKDVHRLPAGHAVEVSKSGLSMHRYWQLNPASTGTRRITPSDAAQELRRIIEQAVYCRLPSFGPVASHMSGGLDSSSIAILAARKLRTEDRPLFAYSFLNQQPEGRRIEDETPFVDAIRAQETDIGWTRIRAPEFSRIMTARMDVDRVLSVEPDDPDNAICADAAGHGVELCLSGWGGDEGPTFNGRGALAEGLLAGRWLYVASEIAALKRMRGWSSARTLRGEVLPYFMPEWLMEFQGRLRGRPSSGDPFDGLLTPTILASLGDIDADRLSLGPNARRNQMRLLASPHLAERAEDWASIGARHGIAFAFPMLDRRVVEFALSLPSTVFLRGGCKRRVFRDAMKDVLPPLIRGRHQKLMPFPDLLVAAVLHRKAILQRLTHAARHPRVRAMFNLDRLRARTAAFNSGDAICLPGGNSDAMGDIAAVFSVLPAIGYLEQHY
jgi:asparagine synthase (glutamine-hydrolysing)